MVSGAITTYPNTLLNKSSKKIQVENLQSVIKILVKRTTTPAQLEQTSQHIIDCEHSKLATK
jgi:hypothetical protein